MTGGLERVHAAIGPLLLPFTLPWRIAIDRRNARFDRGEGVRRVRVPVISVGNLSAGGTGKTPVVRWIAERLLDAGLRPAIALRGYAAGADGSSDEAMEYEDLLPGVPLLVGADRAAAIEARLAADPGAFDVVVLDDGFQHRRLARDLDLVLVDATRPFTGDRLLPAGRLREPASALARADAVIVTRCGGPVGGEPGEADDPASRHAALAEAVERVHGRPPLAWTDHAWRGLERVAGPDRVEAGSGLGLGTLRDCPVGLVAGTGHPRAVAASVEAHGGIVRWIRAAGDHAAYATGDLGRFARAAADAGAELLLVTRKDWVKLRGPGGGSAAVDSAAGSAPPIPVVVPDLAIDVRAGGDALASLVVEAARAARGGSAG